MPDPSSQPGVPGQSGLLYTLTPDEAPASSGQPLNVVNFQLTVSAPTAGAIQCSELIITMTGLTPPSAAPPTVTCQPNGWQARTSGLNEVVVIAPPGSPITAQTPLTVNLNSVAITPQTGTATVNAKMTTAKGLDNVNLTVTVYKASFSVTNFIISPPSPVPPFGQVQLSWETQGTATCTVYSPTNPDGYSPTDNTYTDRPAVTTTYTVEWISSAGSTQETITQQLTAVVDNLAILLFDVWLPAPGAGLSGGAATLRWQTQNAVEVILDPGRIQLIAFNAPGPAAIATVSYVSASQLSIDTSQAGGTATPTIIGYSNYAALVYLTAVDAQGFEVQQAIYLPVPPVTCTLTASTNNANQGAPVTLTWTVNGATSATLDLGQGGGPQNLPLTPPGQATYTGTAQVNQPQYGFAASLSATAGSTTAGAKTCVITLPGIQYTSVNTIVFILADEYANVDLTWLSGAPVVVTPADSTVPARTGTDGPSGSSPLMIHVGPVGSGPGLITIA